MKSKSAQSRSIGFTYGIQQRSGRSFRELCADDVPLTRLAARFGTPLYVYSASTIRERYQQFDRAFAGCAHTICYSVKANSNLSILRMLAQLGAGFDIVSGGELQRVVAVEPKAASSVVFSGVGKLASEMDSALAAGILLFNVESASELELLAARAVHHRTPAQFAIRVNPHVAAKTHPYIATGLHEHKFGVPWRDAPELYRRGAGKRWLKPVGISVHIGSQITDVSAFREAMERLVALVQSLRTHAIDIRYIDAGGGLGITYERSFRSDFSRDAERYAKALARPLKDLGIHLLLEPGRAIIAPAGILLTRVTYRKQNGNKRFVVVDAAMNDLLRPSLYNAYHEIVPVLRKPAERPKEKVDVVGPICESADCLARDRKIARLAEGDLLAILDTGAYGMSLASNYNSRPRAAEVLVEGGKSRLIRKRESIDDLLAPERV